MPDFSVIINYLPIIVQGFYNTIILTVLGSVIAMTLGLGIALCRTPLFFDKNHGLNKLAAVWIELFRNMPLLCLVLFFYYGFHMSGFYATLLAISLHTSVYIAETFRSGFSTVPPEEITSARLLGLKPLQLVRHVLLPRSLESIASPLGNQLVNLLKNTAIGYFVAEVELTSVFEFLTTQTYHFATFFVLTILGYALLGFTISQTFARLERRLLKRYA